MNKRGIAAPKKTLIYLALWFGPLLGLGLFLRHINAPPRLAPPAPVAAPDPNGYALYLAAKAAMTPAAPPVDPVNNPDIITNSAARAAQYSLARKAAWLASNRAGFALFRRAQQTPSRAPVIPSGVGKAGPVLRGYAQMRELARIKLIQSNARWMRGDYNGALQSGLDTVQMGHDIRRGGALLPDLVGIAVGAIGRSVTHDTVDKLSANQARSGARRLEDLLARRWSLVQALAQDKPYAQTSALELFGQRGWRSPRSFARSDEDEGSLLGGALGDLPLATRLRIYTLSKQTIVDDIAADYNREIANARLPYLSKGTPPQLAGDPFLQLFGAPSRERLRFNDARDLAGDQMLMFRLALRAYFLDQGAYPPNLKALMPTHLNSIPADPFGGGGPWNYALSGSSYQLWSIGPDGKNDGGKPIPWRSSPRPRYAGERVRLPYLMQDSVGDYVAGKNG